MDQAIKGGCLLTLLTFMNIQCIWCINKIRDATNRYVIDKSTKTGAEAYRLLENLPFEVNLTPLLGVKNYLCKGCFRELKKRENIIRSLQCCEEKLGFGTRCKKRKVSTTCCDSVNASNESTSTLSKTFIPLNTNLSFSPLSAGTCTTFTTTATSVDKSKQGKQHGVRVSVPSIISRIYTKIYY